MSILVDEARANAVNIINELRLSKELSLEDWQKLHRVVQTIASETVILVKNRVNNL